MNCQQCGFPLDPQQIAQTGRCPRCSNPVTLRAPVQYTTSSKRLCPTVGRSAHAQASPLGAYPSAPAQPPSGAAPPVQPGSGTPPPAFGVPAQGYPGGMLPPPPQKKKNQPDGSHLRGGGGGGGRHAARAGLRRQRPLECAGAHIVADDEYANACGHAHHEHSGGLSGATPARGSSIVSPILPRGPSRPIRRMRSQRRLRGQRIRVRSSMTLRQRLGRRQRRRSPTSA